MKHTLRRMALAMLPALLVPGLAGAAGTGSLGGSPASIRLQHEVAERNHYTFAASDAQLRKLVAQQRLEPVKSSAELRLENVSYPYARPAVVQFVERLAAEYRAAADGAPLVVTSLTRPVNKQPGNAHPLSVHPAGMAVDLRIPRDANMRKWLETRLLALESKGVLDVTRERTPAHYHVAVYPATYESYALTLPPVVRFTPPVLPIETPFVADAAQATSTHGAAVPPPIALVTFAALAAVGAIVACRRRHEGS